ncbi:ABC transporter ATP-binding protein [Sulfitobacter sp.]|uniref:ABC transporter ATP-binding protein n=1 Tax=Sulfitobacter sp. TaxID=1903071 RepID=UPI0030037C00
MTLISAHSVSHYYRSGAGAVLALDKISIDIALGKMIAIMGPSGSGKSTLMNLFGLLDTPSKGSIIFEGRDVSTLSPSDRARLRGRRIGFVFQAYNLLQRLTAVENVEVPLIYAGVKPRERLERARMALAQVGLENRLNHWPAQLSGGEQQRVAIARAIVSAPALILADEPTGALDSKTGDAVMEILRALAQGNTSVVLVTHDQRIASGADRIIALMDGRLAKGADTPAEPGKYLFRHTTDFARMNKS